jgi:hypothetical protein
MEKILGKIYIMSFILMIGTAFVACSNEENLEQLGNQDTQKNYTLTIDASKGVNKASTRALSLEGKTLNATWATTESVYAYDRTSTSHPSGTLHPLVNGVTTTLQGTLSGGTVENYDNISLTYPRTPIDYTGQDGNLTTIATKYDYAKAYATVTSVSATTISASPVTFENQQAIAKFTLKDADENAINATSLTISDGGTGLQLDGLATPTKGDLTITPNSGTNVIFAALRGITNSNLTITATDGTNTYTYIKDNVTFENGKYYEVNLKMKKQVSYTLTSETGALNIPAGEHATLSGTGGSNTHVTIANGAIVTLNGVTINSITNDASHKWAGITCLGNAHIILEGTNVIKGGYEDYPGIHIATNKTLTIKGSGSLTAESGGSGTEMYGAGIGAGYGAACGNIVIQDGEITAIGGKLASGIGGVQNGASCGNITISGGTIIASGGLQSAGIGIGEISPSSATTCGDITISGGTVTANGNYANGTNNGNAPGIGVGPGATCGDITISGGTVNASCHNATSTAAGIGTGHSGTCGNIMISGGNVTASGKQISIGSGYSGTCGDITITNQATMVTMNNATYIGKYDGGSSVCGTVTIDGQTYFSTSTNFPNFTSVVSDGSWILTHK